MRIVEKPQMSHTAYNCIDGQTLAILLNSMTREQFLKKFILIDCRYPFEYDGGHIKVNFEKCLVNNDRNF